jgi:hypothetical protein
VNQVREGAGVGWESMRWFAPVRHFSLRGNYGARFRRGQIGAKKKRGTRWSLDLKPCFCRGFGLEKLSGKIRSGADASTGLTTHVD